MQIICLKTCPLMLPLGEYPSLINAKAITYPISISNSFIIENWSSTVDFELYYGEEAPPDTGNPEISVEILHSGVRQSLSFLYTQPMLAGLANLGWNFNFVLDKTSMRTMNRQLILIGSSRYQSIQTRLARCSTDLKQAQQRLRVCPGRA